MATQMELRAVTSLQQSLERARQQRQVQQPSAEINEQLVEAQKKLEGATYEDYAQRYSQIPENLRQYFLNPSDLMQSPEYQDYQKEFQSYNEAVAYQTALDVYAGRIPRPAGFDEQSEIAKKAAKEVWLNPRGYEPSYVEQVRLGKMVIEPKNYTIYIPSGKLSVSQGEYDKYKSGQNFQGVDSAGNVITSDKYGKVVTPKVIAPPTTNWNLLKELQFQAHKGIDIIYGRGTEMSPYERDIALGRVREVPRGYTYTPTTSGGVYTSPEGKSYKYTDFPRVNIKGLSTRESFQPLLGALGAYVSTTIGVPEVSRSTLVKRLNIRPLTIWESLDIKGDYSTSNIKAQREKLSQLKNAQDRAKIIITEIERIGRGNIDKNNVWVGSDKDLEAYNEKIKEYEEEQRKFNVLGGTITTEGEWIEPKIRAGGKFGRDIPITEYYTGGVFEPVNIFALEYGTAMGVGVEKTLNTLGYVPKETLVGGTGDFAVREVPFPMQRGTLFLSPEGKPLPQFEVFKPYVIKQPTAEEIGMGVTKAIQIGVSTGKYFIPYIGQPIAIIETVEQLGKYKYNPIEFFKAEPLQAGLLTLGVVSPFIIRGLKSERVQEFFGRKIRISSKGFRVIPSETQQLRELEMAKNLLLTEAQQGAKNIKQRLELEKKITNLEQKIGIKKPSMVYIEEGGIIKEFPSTQIGIEDTKFYKTTSDLGFKSQGKVDTSRQLSVKESGTELPKEVNLFVGYSESGKPIFVKKTLQELRLSPDIGVTKGIQIVPTTTYTKGGVTNIVGASAGIGKKGQPISIENFVGSGKKGYIYFESYTQKLGRKPRIIEETLLGKAGERQVVKVTKIGKGVIKVEYRTLPQLKKNFYMDDIQKALEKGKGIGKKTFERASRLKTEIYVYKETPLGRGYELKLILKPEETIIRKGIINKKLSVGFGAGIKSQEQLDKEIVKIVTKKTPLSVTFGEKVTKQLSKQEFEEITKKIVPSLKPKIITPRVTIPRVETLYPTYVGGTMIREATSLGEFGGMVTTEEVQPMNLPAIKEKTLIKPTDFIEQKPILRTEEIGRNVLGFKEIQKVRESLIQVTIPEQKTRLGEIQIQPQKQILKQAQISELAKVLIAKPTKLTKPTIPKIPIPKVPIKLPTTTPKKIVKEKLGEMFEVFKKTKGKDISAGEEVSLIKAGKKLKEELKLGLEASGYVVSKKTGKKVSFEELAPVLGTEFRPAKKDIFRIVQKKEKRLGTGSEVFKIQRERGKRKNRMKWL